MDISQLKVILIHGNGGGTIDDQGIFFPYLKTELEKLGLTVIAKTFPDNDLARAKYWLPFLEELGANENSILIGHSSGAEAAMRYAETHKIYGSVLISPCYTDGMNPHEAASGYYDHPWDWDQIKANQNWIIQFYSTDDPYIHPEEANFVKIELNTEYYEYHNQGHFYPKTEFPEIIKVIKEKLNL